MTDRRNPIHSQSATFYVDGTKRGQGALVLYPDELAAVIAPTGTWGYLAGPALFLAITIPLFHTIGWLGISATSLVGGWTGEALTRRRVARKAAAGGDGVTVIPLELVTGVQAAKPTKAAGWLGLRNITVTADGTKYEFRGTTEKWMAHLAAALTEYGREVHAAAESITVLPWATLLGAPIRADRPPASTTPARLSTPAAGHGVTPGTPAPRPRIPAWSSC